MKSLLIIAAVLLAVAPAFGQRKTSMAKSQIVRVKEQSSIFITYDHSDKREPLEADESSEGVWLRLHNNTRATIFLPSFTVPRSLGDVGMFYEIVSTADAGDYQEGSTTNSANETLPVGYRIGHTSGAYFLRPGRSVSFSVPREHLAERAALKISFNYLWELYPDRGAVKVGEPEHFVLFQSSSLPPSDSAALALRKDETVPGVRLIPFAINKRPLKNRRSEITDRSADYLEVPRDDLVVRLKLINETTRPLYYLMSIAGAEPVGCKLVRKGKSKLWRPEMPSCARAHQFVGDAYRWMIISPGGTVPFEVLDLSGTTEEHAVTVFVNHEPKQDGRMEIVSAPYRPLSGVALSQNRAQLPRYRRPLSRTLATARD